MIYVVLRPKKGKDIIEVCIVKAKSDTEAKKIVGVEGMSTEWAGFTEAEFSAMINAKEGYIVKDM